MVIEALGVRPQMSTSLTQQTREIVDTQEAEAGNVNVISKTDEISDRKSSEEQGQLGQPGSNNLQEMMTHVEETVTEQIDATRKENKIDQMSHDDISAKEQVFKQELQTITERASKNGPADVGFVSESVLDAVNKLAQSLKFSLDSTLPSVPPAPWEANYPSHPEGRNVPLSSEGVFGPSIDEQA